MRGPITGSPARVLRAVTGAAALLLWTTACGGGGDATRAAQALPPQASVATAGTPAPTGDSSGTAATTSTTAATGSVDAAPVSVPVTMLPGPQDQPYLTAQINVGGGAPATVWLDTGSSGLLINSSAVGSQVTDTGTAIGTDYTSGKLVGTLARATVQIGEATTAEPIAFGLLNEQESTFATPQGTVGIMGIATANDSDLAQQQIFAPQLQLPAPWNAGSTLQVVEDGTGTWTLGPVAATAGQVAVPMTPATGSTTGVPAGYPAFLRPLDLCWTIGSASSTCGPTDLDTGSPSTILSQSDYTSLAAAGDLLPAPTPVAVAAPDGSSLWSFTSGTGYADDTVGVADIGSSRFNTGLGFFVGRTVAWDFSDGRVLVGPAS